VGGEPGPRDAVAGVALTTQRATMVDVDAAGKPLRPAIVWLDQRRVEGLHPMGPLWQLAFRVLQLRQTVAHYVAESEANWIRTHHRRSGRGHTSTCFCPVS